MSFLSKIFGGDATEKAGKKNAASLDGLQKRGTGYINTGAAASRDYLDDVPELYEPYAESGRASREMLDNGLGLGGEEGSAAALEALRSTPGFRFQQEEAARAAERGASASGMLASGNLLAELSDRAQGIADTTQGSWLDRLFQSAGQGLQAAGGQAQGITNQAGLEQDITGQRMGLDASVVNGLNQNRNNVAAAKEAGKANMVGLGQKFLGFLNPVGA